ncbi:MAG: hypothetical protein ACREL7_07765 [Longimicrobiales bacterium]
MPGWSRFPRVSRAVAAGSDRTLFVFLDGVGLGRDDAATNAFVTADLPVLSGLLGGRQMTANITPLRTERASLFALDASLGMDGTPQSGTGQAALFTGINAAKQHGRHFGPWVPASLRPLVREQSVLARARAAGRRVAFANAYPEELFVQLPVQQRGQPFDLKRAARAPGGGAPRFLRTGAPLAALGAGVLTRHSEALARGDAVASEITNDGWRERLGRSDLPVISPQEAGANLASIANAHDLTLFAHYSTDYAGHEERLDVAARALERVDAFLGGVVGAMSVDLLLIVASDHGNIEDCTTGHTRNPAPGLVVGDGHARIGPWTSILEVAPAILDRLLEARPTIPTESAEGE